MGNGQTSEKKPKAPAGPSGDEEHKCKPKEYRVMVVGNAGVGKTAVTNLIIQILEDIVLDYTGDKLKGINENWNNLILERLSVNQELPHITGFKLTAEIPRLDLVSIIVKFEEVSGLEHPPADGSELPAPFNRIRNPPIDDYWLVVPDGDKAAFAESKLWRNAIANSVVPKYKSNQDQVSARLFGNRCQDPDGQKLAVSFSDMEKAKGLWNLTGFIPIKDLNHDNNVLLREFVMTMLINHLGPMFPPIPDPNKRVVVMK